MSRLSVLLGSAVCVCAFHGALAQDASVGVNAAIRNSVQEKAQTEPALHPAVLRASVHLGDSVVSGNDSALQLLLRDHSVFTVGANARMTIDRFVYDPNAGTSDVAASIATGAFRFMSGHTLAGFGQKAISTPVATIGVRGTIVEGAVGQDALNVLSKQSGLPSFTPDPNNTSVIVLVGPGKGSEGFDKPGAIDVNGVPVEDADNAVVIPGAGQAPIGPFHMDDAALGALDSLLAPKPGGGDHTDFNIQSASNAAGQTLEVGPVPGDPYQTEVGTISTHVEQPSD
jgi:hypothetical protein